jgi:hypothetical protein
MRGSKSSRNSPTSRKRGAGRGAGTGTGVPWGALLFLTLLSAAAVGYFWQGGYLHWYGDAAAHLNIARRLLDSRTTGYDQIGTVWLPLPHILMMGPAAVDRLWETGLAGAIPTAMCFVAAGVLLFQISRMLYGCERAAWTALLVFALNPNLLYLQSLAMTEAYFVCAVLLALYGTLRGSGWVTGLALLAATMTRYEGWFLIPFAVGYLFWKDRRAGVLAGAIASAGPVYWVAHNYVFHGDALEFYRGIGSAKWIYEQGLARGYERAPGDGDFVTAARYYATAGRLFVGWPLAALALPGLLAMGVRRAWWAAVFLLLGPVFFVWSMHGSGATIFVPVLHPFTYYNTRYGMIVLPLAALAAAAIPAILPHSSRKWVAGLVVAAAVSPWVLYPRQETWVVWKESERNSIARRAWTREAAAYLKERYVPGRGIVSHFGDQTGILRDAGIPIRESVHEDNRPQFDAIVARPDLFLWQEWVIVLPGDRLGKSMSANAGKLPRYRRVKIVNVDGAPAVEIWRRSGNVNQ